MKLKACFIRIGCLVVGLAIGYFFEHVRAKRTIVEALAIRDNELTELGTRAMEAYHSTNRPVAIYAFTRYVTAVQLAEDPIVDDYDPFVTKADFQRRLMFAHARLAKLLTANGDNQEATNHIAAALKCAQASGRFSFVTNETLLFGILPENNRKPVP
jgi:hypothetical protein